MSVLQGDNSCKVFVGGLAPTTTVEILKTFFSQYGGVADASIMMMSDKGSGIQRSRGFGFVQFDTADIIDSVIGLGKFSERMTIDQKEVDVKRIDEERGSQEGRQEVEQRKCFVGGLPDTCDAAALKEYFRTAVDPNVQEARVMTDPKTERSRCFGYVTFSTQEMMHKAVSMAQTHYIGGKWIDVKASNSGKKGASKGGKGGKYNGAPAYGGGYGGGKGKGGYAPYGGKPDYSKGQPSYGQPAGGAAYGAPPSYGYGAQQGGYNAYGAQQGGYSQYPQAAPAYGQQPAYGYQPAPSYPAQPAAGYPPAGAPAANGQQYAYPQPQAPTPEYGYAQPQAAAATDPYAGYQRQAPY